jgi:hypothetical protein
MSYTIAFFSGAVAVVLSSLSVLKDLLEKRGKTYSEKPSLPAILEMYVFSILISPISRDSGFSLYARI